MVVAKASQVFNCAGESLTWGVGMSPPSGGGALVPDGGQLQEALQTDGLCVQVQGGRVEVEMPPHTARVLLFSS